MSVKYEGTFLEIITVRNGFAVYDYSIRHKTYSEHGHAPMVVFRDKKSLCDWLTNDFKAWPHEDWAGSQATPKPERTEIK